MNSILIVIVLMVVAGLLGGLTGNFFVPTPTDGSRPAVRLRLAQDIVVAEVASFMVPLFLSLAQSDLLKSLLDEAAKTGTGVSGYFTLFGFCLAASVSARKFVNMMSGKVIDQIMTRQDGIIQSQRINDSRLDELIENTAPARTDPAPPDAPIDVPNVDLNGPEKNLLHELGNGGFDKRTLDSLAHSVKLSIDATRHTLDRLDTVQLVSSEVGPKTGKIFYRLTPAGRAVAVKDGQPTD